jgi:hypothetical protein
VIFYLSLQKSATNFMAGSIIVRENMKPKSQKPDINGKNFALKRANGSILDSTLPIKTLRRYFGR